MENTTFIPANQLPEAEGDEVSVLCLENGEMKQKPAKGLGGGYDMKVRIWFEFDAEQDSLMPRGEVLEGDYATALAKINDGTPAIVRIVEDATGDDLPEDWRKYKSVTDSFMGYMKFSDMEVLVANGFEAAPGILPDNSIVFN